MKIIVQLLSFFFPVLLVAQEQSTTSPLSMPWEQNQQWLLMLKTQEKPLQWKMITDRYFQSEAIAIEGSARLYTPVLIISGLLISITDSTSREVKRKLESLLAEDKISEIRILEKQPEGLYIERPFTGIILATISDKKTSKALKKIKVH